MSITDEKVTQFIRERIFERSPIFLQMQGYAKEHKVPIIPPETASFLRQLIHLKKPSRILEIGTAIGYSAMVFASAGGHDVIIDTIERSHEMVEVAERNVGRSHFSKRINVIEGDGLAVLSEMVEKMENAGESHKYDVIFIDAAKGQYMKFFEESVKLLNDDGLIICDNVLYRGLVADLENTDKRSKTMVKKMVEFVDYITSDKALQTSIVPVGDGIALVRVKGCFAE